MSSLQNQTILDGSTPVEVILTILPTFLYVAISIQLVTILGKLTTGNFFQHFLVDFMLVIVPSILTFTVWSENVYTIIFSVGNLLLLLVVYKVGCSIFNTRTSIRTFNSYSYFITNSRATINILAVIAILAVDFQIFPRHFAKTTNYGYSLMDTGVGLFIYSNGLVAPEARNKRNPISNSIKGSIILLLLGCTRLFLTKQVDYNVSAIEYGVHWNFFFTLAFTKIFTSFILNCFHIKFIYLNSLMLILSHEMLLQIGLKNFVIESKRTDDVFSANKEGIVSLPGYISLYLFSVFVGYILNINKNKNSFWNILIFAVMSGISLLLCLMFQNLFEISRRLANAAYCFWILFIGTFMTGLYYLLQKFQGRDGTKKNETIFCPVIFEAVNYNGLIFFLLGNILTGVVNLSINTWSKDKFTSIVILVCYMFVNCLLVCILRYKNIKLKL